jgi:carbamoylphosphate synthase large subunit
VEAPDPANENHWCFPDTEEGILSAVGKGATHLWANTVLFAAHPLQTSSLLDAYETSLKVVGQPPKCFDMYDDKSFLNDALRRRGMRLPRSWTVHDPLLATPTSQGDPDTNLPAVLASIPESDYPLVAKPVRGPGSHGVKNATPAPIWRSMCQPCLTNPPAC